MGSISASAEESGGAKSPGSHVGSNHAGDDDFVLVGLITRPHGVRGSVKVEIWSDVPDRFKPGRKLFLAADGRPPRQVRIVRSQPARGGAIVHFDSVGTREQAEDIRGHRLQVPRSEVPDAPAGLYYHFDLIGCRCVDAELGDLGEVQDILEDGGGELLEIARSGRTLLVPFVAAFLESVDVAKKKILLRLPEGLVETCESRS